MRIDLFLAAQFPDLSRSYFQYLIEQQSVLIQGSPVKKRTLVEEGDIVEVTLLESQETVLTPEPMSLDILYEDEDLLALNKPSGLVVHPGAGNRNGTLINGVLHYAKTLPESDDPLRPGVVHRLDKDTSGVILIAKTRRMHTRLIDLFSERKIQKTYLAICHNKPSRLSVDAPIGRHRFRRKEMSISENGKSAQTEFQLIDQYGSFSLLRALPKTGRTHQIRVHLNYLKCPIVGDETYGPKNPLHKRQLLHAHKLEFIHPTLKKTLSIEAPLPEDFRQFAEKHFLTFSEEMFLENLPNQEKNPRKKEFGIISCVNR